MSVYFLGDPHLGHKNIAKFRPWVKGTKHNTEIFIQKYTELITKRSLVFFMGDVAFDEESLHLVGNLPGRSDGFTCSN